MKHEMCRLLGLRVGMCLNLCRLFPVRAYAFITNNTLLHSEYNVNIVYYDIKCAMLCLGATRDVFSTLVFSVLAR